MTYAWKLERKEGNGWVVVYRIEGGKECRCIRYTFREEDGGKQFRISCTVKAYGRNPQGEEVSCGSATAYAFARVIGQNELAVSLEASPEPAGVWQTIKMTATVDTECGGTPPFTYRWHFGDDPNKVIVRPDLGKTDSVDYFYKSMYRYRVYVEVEDSSGQTPNQRRRGYATMWVHVGLEVRLGMPMSMYVPLRQYNEEGLADPNWNIDQVNYTDYLHDQAPYQAKVVSVAVSGQTLPYVYEHQKT